MRLQDLRDRRTFKELRVKFVIFQKKNIYIYSRITFVSNNRGYFLPVFSVYLASPLHKISVPKGVISLEEPLEYPRFLYILSGKKTMLLVKFVFEVFSEEIQN